MAEQWSPNVNIFQPAPAPAPAPPAPAEAKDGSDSDPETQYDRKRLAALPQGFDGWRTELRQYLAQEEDRTVSKKTDLCRPLRSGPMDCQTTANWTGPDRKKTAKRKRPVGKKTGPSWQS